MKRDLKGLGSPHFLSPSQPYFGKQNNIHGLIFIFRNQTVLERGFGPEPDKRSPIWACFLLTQRHPYLTTISRQQVTKNEKQNGETRKKSNPGSIPDQSRINPGSIPDQSRINPGSIPDQSRINPGSRSGQTNNPDNMLRARSDRKLLSARGRQSTPLRIRNIFFRMLFTRSATVSAEKSNMPNVLRFPYYKRAPGYISIPLNNYLFYLRQCTDLFYNAVGQRAL